MKTWLEAAAARGAGAGTDINRLSPAGGALHPLTPDIRVIAL